MRKFLLTTAAILCFSTPSFAADTVNLAPPTGAVLGIAAKAIGGAGIVGTIGAAPVGAFMGFVLLSPIFCEINKNCSGSTVASAEELRQERFASAGLFTTTPAYTAKAQDLAAENRASLLAAYSASQETSLAQVK